MAVLVEGTSPTLAFPKCTKCNKLAWLGRVRLSDIATGSGIGILLTTLLCYLLAASLGHARAVLPMISDCFARFPESYVGGWGMGVFVGVGLGCNVIAMAAYLNRYPTDSESEIQLRVCAGMLGLIACSGFWVVSIVTERDNNALHLTGALVGFITHSLYCIAATAALHARRHDGVVSLWSLRIKVAASVLGVAAIATFVLLVANGALIKTEGGVSGDQAVACCEWVALIVIVIFNVSYRLEFGPKLRAADVLPFLSKNVWIAGAHFVGAKPLLACDVVQIV